MRVVDAICSVDSVDGEYGIVMDGGGGKGIAGIVNSIGAFGDAINGG